MKTTSFKIAGFFKKAYSNFDAFIDRLIRNRWARPLIYLGGSSFLLFSLFFFSIYLGVWGKLPNKIQLKNIKQSLATQVLDRNGEVIGKFFVFDRRPVDFNEIPQHLIDALIATEDMRFYEHDGIDKMSLLRVFFKSLLLQDDSAGGGSTITQQLAKNLYGRYDGGTLGLIASKFKEFIIAQRLEHVYSKDEILALYLNTVPFPDNTYGIESASQKFFNKSTRYLTLNESAILVGTLKANNSYNPRLYPDRADQRKEVVINQMLRYGYLKPKDTVALKKDTVDLNYQYYDDSGTAPYFREQLRRDLIARLKEYKKEDGTPYDLYQDGLSIETTIDKTLQSYAEESMREHMQALQGAYVKAWGKRAPWEDPKILSTSLQQLSQYKTWTKAGLEDSQIKDSLNKKREMHIFDYKDKEKKAMLSIKDSLSYYLSLLNCGFMAMDPQSGNVLAYVGGIDYAHFKYDHVSQSKRMVGSTFKPFLYTTALEEGMDPCTYYSDAKETYIVDGKEWEPANAEGEGDEEKDISYSMLGALSRSVNTVAVKVMLDLGFQKVIDQAERMGINTKLPHVPSLALGTAQIRLKDLLTAYSPFVNDGKIVTPQYITKITDRNGRVLFEAEPPNPDEEEKVINDFTRETMIQMMRATVNEGTATRLRYTYGINNDIAGKTGTTQDNKDGWFMGLTPKMITATWVGNDDYRIGFSSTRIGQGANSALPIFAKFYKKLSADTTFVSITKAKFKKPSREVIKALDCESIKENKNTIGDFFSSIFGESKEEEKDPIYIDNEGKRAGKVNTERENLDEDNDEQPGNKKKKGFFSFLKKGNKDKNDNN